MIRFVRFLCPWGLLLFGCAFLYKGLTVLSMDVETEATPVSITAIEEGSVPNAAWLEISDGFFYWPAGGSHVSQVEYEDGNREIKKELGYYVPLVSLPVAAEWASQKGDERTLEKCRVLIFLPTGLMEREHPDVLAGEMVLPFEPATVKGLRKPVRQLADEPRYAFFSGTHALDRSEAIFVKSGYRPMQKDEAAVMAKMGGWMAGPSLLWIVWRRIQRKRRKVRAELLGSETASFDDHEDPNLHLACAKCGAAVRPDTKFCRRCGSEIMSSVLAAEDADESPALVGASSQDTKV